jgi:hypothetical protein
LNIKRGLCIRVVKVRDYPQLASGRFLLVSSSVNDSLDSETSIARDILKLASEVTHQSHFVHEQDPELFEIKHNGSIRDVGPVRWLADSARSFGAAMPA